MKSSSEALNRAFARYRRDDTRIGYIGGGRSPALPRPKEQKKPAAVIAERRISNARCLVTRPRQLNAARAIEYL
jgi:hypothetical protein